MTSRLLLPLTVLLALLGGLVVDAVVADPGLPDGPAPASALAAGATTCAALGTADGATSTALALAGPVPAALAGEDARATLLTEQEGAVAATDTVRTDGTLVSVPVVSGIEAPLLTSRWRTAPVVLSRAWQRPGGELVPPALVEGPCPAAAATTWFVPGVATAGGASAELHLANPFDATATAAIRFTTAAGPVAPTRLRNVVVPARGAITLDLGTYAPEEPDLGVIVELQTGRVVAEAVQLLRPAIGGVAGASHVVAHPAPAETWTVPWAVVGEDTTSWLWITNPGDSGADVRLVVHGADGPTVPPEGGLLVAPGTTERIDLGQLLPPGEPAAVTVRAGEGTPVLVAGAVVRSDVEPARSGIAVVGATAGVLGGVSGSESAQVVAALGGAGRTGLVVVTNPGVEDAVVDVVALTASGGSSPIPGGTGLAVAAGSTEAVVVDDVTGGAHALVVTPRTGAVVAALVEQTGGAVLPTAPLAEGEEPAPEEDTDGAVDESTDEDADGPDLEDEGPPQLDLVVTVAVPFPTLVGSVPLVGSADPTVLTRVGTPGGPRTDDRTDDSTDREDADPAATPDP